MIYVEKLHVLRVIHEATQWDKDGEVVVRSGRDTGRMYFTAGQLAWCMASTHERTFTRYLADHSKLTPEEIEEVYQECERTGANLAETVVSWGLLPGPTVRRLLLEHVAEVLLEILAWPTPESMFMPEQRTYQRLLTFDFAEVLETVCKFDVDGKLPWGRTPATQILKALDEMDDKEKLLGKGEPKALRTGGGSGGGRRAVVWVLVLLLLGAAGAAGYIYRAQLFEVLGLEGATAKPDAGVEVDGATSGRGEPAAVVADAGAPAEDAGPAPAAADAGPAGADAPAQSADAGPGATELAPSLHKLPEGIVALAPGPGSGSIRVLSKPAKARIYLDGLYTGKRTPAVIEGLTTDRPHFVLVHKKRFRPTFEKVRLDEGEEKDVKLRAKRSRRRLKGFGNVRMLSQPEGAVILYNGKPLTKKTPADLRLPLWRSSKIELRLPGHAAWSGRIHPARKLPFSVFVELKSE